MYAILCRKQTFYRQARPFIKQKLRLSRYLDQELEVLGHQDSMKILSELIDFRLQLQDFLEFFFLENFNLYIKI